MTAVVLDRVDPSCVRATASTTRGGCSARRQATSGIVAAPSELAHEDDVAVTECVGCQLGVACQPRGGVLRRQVDRDRRLSSTTYAAE